MTPNRITVALEKYGKQIPKDSIAAFQNNLKAASDECMDEFMSLPTKGKTKTLLLSIFLGGLAIDRFYVGDVGIGVAKLGFRLLATFLSGVPALGIISSIWCFADIFLTYRVAKRINYEFLTAFLRRHLANEAPLT